VDNNEPPILSVALAELSVLKAEIAQRSGAQQTLFALNVTAAGAVASFALSGSEREAVWLVLPLLSPIFGVL
jgi:hypothetical protein